MDDLSSWRYDGVIFESIVNGNKDVLYAPDVAEVVDEETGKKTYYLYPNNQAGGRSSQVAKSDRPDGPFEVINWNPSNPTQTVGVLGFDPAVFVDDDGRVYGYWGFQTSYACELDPTTMATKKEGTDTITNMIDNVSRYNSGLDTTSPNGWRFYEASSIRKIGDTYVFIYSRVGNPNEPTGMNYNQLAYAYSTESPLGPWTYGGIIVDAGGEVIPNGSGGYSRTFNGGNTHGSICEIDGQWYVFYHRNLSTYARQAMAEPIDLTLNDDGSVDIKMAEVTSNGFSLDGLDPYRKHSAGIVSYLTPTSGTKPAIRPAYSEDTDSLPIYNIKNDVTAGIKYFNFDNPAPEGKTTRLDLGLVPLGVDAAIDVYLRPVDARNTNSLGEVIGTINLTADMPQVYTTLSIPVPRVDEVDGQYGIFFKFRDGPNNTNLCELYDLQFVISENYFEDDFENGLTYWTKSGGPNTVVTAEDSTLTLLGTGAQATNKLGKKWSDYSFESNIKSFTGTLNLRFRQSDDNNFYQLAVTNDQLELSSTLYGTKSVIQTVNHSAGSTPFQTTVDAVGDQISVRINGALLMVAKNSDHEIGTIGFAAGSGSTAAIDSVKVSKSTYAPPPVEDEERVDSITVDGTPLEGFTETTYSYLMAMDSDSETPVVGASSTDSSVKISVSQAETIPGTAIVRFIGSSETKSYFIKFYTEDAEEFSFAGLSELPQGWEYAHTSEEAKARVGFDETGILLNCDTGPDYPVKDGEKHFPAIQLAEPLEGDWQIEVKFSADQELNSTTMGGTQYESYGLALYSSDSAFVKYVVQNRGNTQNVQMAGSSMSESNTAQTGTTVYLRFVKVGNTLTGYRSADGVNFIRNTQTTLSDAFDNAKLQIFATENYGTTAYKVWAESISYVGMGDFMESSPDQQAVEAAASLIGGSLLIPDEDYADEQAKANKALEIITAKEEIQALGVTCAVVPSNSQYVLTITKGTASLKVDPFMIAVNSADWTALEELINQTQSLSEYGYTLASWNKLQTALKNAVKLDATSDSIAIISAYNRLEAALNALEEVVDDGGIISVSGVNNGGYTNSSEITVKVLEDGVSMDSLTVLKDGEIIEFISKDSDNASGKLTPPQSDTAEKSDGTDVPDDESAEEPDDTNVPDDESAEEPDNTDVPDDESAEEPDSADVPDDESADETDSADAFYNVTAVKAEYVDVSAANTAEDLVSADVSVEGSMEQSEESDDSSGVYRCDLDLTQDGFGDGSYQLIADLAGEKYSFTFISDRTVPEIVYDPASGLVTVTDTYLEKVFLNGVETNASFTLNNKGTYIVEAADKAGNHTVTRIAIGSHDNSSDGGSSSGNDGDGALITVSPKKPVASPVNAKQAVSLITSAIQSGSNSARLINPSGISLETMQKMADTAGNSAIKIHADSLNDQKGVDVRITFDPAKATKDIDLYASTFSKLAQKTKAIFEKYFSNKVTVVNCSQKGGFGMQISMAVKLDADYDIHSLCVYVYDSSTNTYKQMKDPDCFIDAGGYLHFNTELSGDIVISDRALLHR